MDLEIEWKKTCVVLNRDGSLRLSSENMDDDLIARKTMFDKILHKIESIQIFLI
jgi:hypothetical protein